MSFTFKPTWSYMKPPSVEEAMLDGGGEPFLENLAVAARSLAKDARRYAGRAVKAAHEVRQVGKADIEGDLGDRLLCVGEQPRRMAQPRAHQILVRRDVEHAGKEPQEMKRAQPGRSRDAIEVEVFARVRVDPVRRFDRASPVARPMAVARRSRDRGYEPGCERHADFVQPELRVFLCGSLRKLAKHHQPGERRDRTGAPRRR